ncbi:MAG: Rieske (2Fe-2S) protein [Candidatus Adiutrix sp.]|jgi:menaquinol-cytochrome c reductase iron-sulfur subunit|nr:Rieske (2Fe-2S) protein [Candidatus Adiutrix sp.]
MAAVETETPHSRRRFLARGLAAAVALLGLGLGLPLAGFSLSPLRKRGKSGDWISLIKVSELQDSRPTKVTYQYDRQDGWTTAATKKMAYVVQNNDGTLTVLSNRCTHLGCGVDWDARAGQFRCPCHGGVFDPEGRVVEGPPPSPLPRLVSRVEDGTVFIREA